MDYFICQSWKNTKHNHAGMVHLCAIIKDIDPINVRCYNLPHIQFKGFHRISKQVYWVLYFFVALFLYFKVKKKDRVFLMEYLHINYNQHIISKILRLKKNNIKVVGMVHLVPNKLDQMFSIAKLKRWCNDVDLVVTLGSSLSKYLELKGITTTKVYTTFHYVDSEYYRPFKRKALNTEINLKVIIMGNMQRDFQAISHIVESVPNIDFYLLQGIANVDNIFNNYKNVRTFGFLEEKHLREILSECDISLNVMLDTIGSNVITTSMAMELAMLVSDVGSIRDYCDNTNAFFCKSTDDFVFALQKLNLERDLLLNMQKNSFLLSERFNAETFYKELSEHL